MPDSSLAIRLKAHNSFENIHQEKLAAQVLGGTFATLLEQGKLQLAAHYMKKYEENSGYFNSNGDIEKGREVYYYYKGLYFLCVDSLEKAYSLFQQIEKDTSEVNNRKAYYKGMFEYYKKSHNVPMSARFAELYAIASDSSYQALSTEKMYAMQASYIYNRNERIATLFSLPLCRLLCQPVLESPLQHRRLIRVNLVQGHPALLFSLRLSILMATRLRLSPMRTLPCR